MADHDDNGRVAVLVDCDNTTPDILEFALQRVAQFGRVVMRRGYGHSICRTWCGVTPIWFSHKGRAMVRG